MRMLISNDRGIEIESVESLIANGELDKMRADQFGIVESEMFTFQCLQCIIMLFPKGKPRRSEGNYETSPTVFRHEMRSCR